MDEIQIQPTQPDLTISHENETHACRFACLCLYGTGWTTDDSGKNQAPTASQPGDEYFSPLRTRCARSAGQCTRSSGRLIRPESQCIRSAGQRGGGHQHCCSHHSPCEQKGPPQHVPESPENCSRPEIKRDFQTGPGWGERLLISCPLRQRGAAAEAVASCLFTAPFFAGIARDFREIFLTWDLAPPPFERGSGACLPDGLFPPRHLDRRDFWHSG